jgi:hypothetical protein
MVSKFDAPRKMPSSIIVERKNELADQILAHPEHTESILSEVTIPEILFRTVYAQNYGCTMSLMEARKNQLYVTNMLAVGSKATRS